MRPDRKFSRFIMGCLMVFMGISTVLITTGTYFYRVYSMEKSADSMFDMSQREFGNTVTNQLNNVRQNLDRLLSENMLVDYIINNEPAEISNLINTEYRVEAKGIIIIYDSLNNRFIPDLAEDFSAIEPLLKKISTEKEQTVKFQEIRKGLFMSVFSSPIEYMNKRIGTCYLLYDISKDTNYWETVQGGLTLNRILIHDGQGRLFNLETGEEIAVPGKDISSLLSNTVGPLKEFFKGEKLIPLSGYPNLFYGANNNPFNEQKRALKIILFNICAAVLVITIIVSFFIARIVSRPLERMANEAAKIANAPSDMLLNEEKAEYLEFKKLSGAFNRVLSRLFKAQEELRSEARKELEASEERYRLTVEAAPDGIVLLRLHEGTILQANDTFSRLTGYPREELIGRTTIELSLYHDPMDREKLYDALEEKGEVNNLEIRLRGKDGRAFDCLLSVRKIMFQGKDSAIVVMSDNSEKKEAEAKIRDSYKTLQMILDSMPTCIVIVGVDRKIRHANRAALKLLGYHSEEDVKGKICHRFICAAEEGRCPISDLNQTIDLSERFVLASDGRKIPIYKSVISVTLNNEDVLIEAFFDLTEFKKTEDERSRLEAALQRASKMEAIGVMAGGVAHDLNNILSGLVGYPELLLMDLPENSPLRKPILAIQKSGEKAAAIVQDMLTLARRGVAVTEVVNLNAIIREYLKSPEHKRMMTYHKDVQLKLDLEPNLLNIIGSEIHLSKTFMNMFSNSLEAMPEGGGINISTNNEYIDMPIRGYDNVNEGDYVVLTVSDNGSGISPEDQEKIFEPFYTKKKMGRSGTGLGMAVVWGTVKDHDGYIDLKSEIGKGSTFKLYFPITRRELKKEESEFMFEKYMGRGESVLVVDDIHEQREIAYNMLSKLGYTVAAVSSGEDAVEYMKQNSADILVLDMIMAPGIDGLDTYKRVLEIHPGQKAVVASGFSETEKVREAQRLGAGAYVKKPYLMKNIGPAIRKELDK